MNLKTATLIALVCSAIYALATLGGYFVRYRQFNYDHDSGILPILFDFAFKGSLALFFFTLYSKQNRS